MVNQAEFVKVQEELAQVQGVVSELDTKLEGLRDEVVQQFDRTARDMNKLQRVVQRRVAGRYDKVLGGENGADVSNTAGR